MSHKVALRLLVLVAGMTTMATEMSASRLLAPFFGASVMVWANIIGLILIYLSVGYWYGGRLADRHPHMRGLCTVTLAAAVAIALVPFVASPVLSVAVGGFDDLSVGAVVGSFLGSLLLFSVPITLLGMVPPYAVRLAMREISSAGQVAGSLYALSTIGSILGTFGAVLVFIPWIGTRRTMLVFALALALLSIWGLRRRMIGAGVAVGIAALIAVPVGLVKDSADGRTIFERESPYQFVQVVERADGERLLQLNEGWAVHSLYRPGSVMTGGIWDHFLLLPELASRDVDSMLIIGNAAGSAARAFSEVHPEVRVDGVEIDPVVTEVGRRYFDMPDDMRVYDADGRPFLAATQERWDVIHIDAYRQPYIPFYLTTREFFALVDQRLTNGGLLAINVGAPPDDDRIVDAIAATMRSEFPSVFRYRAEEFNELVIATSQPVTLEELRGRLEASPLYRDERTSKVARLAHAQLSQVAPSPGDVLTDDHAPVEWMTDRMIVQFASGGEAQG